MIKTAAEEGADMILFPEVQLTEFFPQFEKQDVRKYRLQIDSPQVKAFIPKAIFSKRERGIESLLARPI